jgi:hypothetical protein
MLEILAESAPSPHPAEFHPRSWWCKFAGRREAVKRTWDNQTGGRSAERWKLNLSRGSLSLHSDVFVSDVLRAISERMENLTTNTSSSLPLSISWLSPIVIYLSISLGISGAPFEILWQFGKRNHLVSCCRPTYHPVQASLHLDRSSMIQHRTTLTPVATQTQFGSKENFATQFGFRIIFFYTFGEHDDGKLPCLRGTTSQKASVHCHVWFLQLSNVGKTIINPPPVITIR